MKFIFFAALIIGTACLIMISGFVLPTIVALIVLILAVAGDSFTTWKCLKRGRKEGNPLIAFLFRKIGVKKTFALIACVWVCFIVFRWLPSSESSQTAIAIAYWLVPINNFVVLTRVIRKQSREVRNGNAY